MRNALIGLGAVAGLVVCGFVAVPAAAAPTGSEQRVIVLLRDQHPQTPATRASSGRRAAALSTDQAPVRRNISRLGGVTTHAYRALNAVSATLPASAVSTLRTDPAVATVVPDLRLAPPESRSARHRLVAGASRISGAGMPGRPGQALARAGSAVDEAHQQPELEHSNGAFAGL